MAPTFRAELNIVLLHDFFAGSASQHKFRYLVDLISTDREYRNSNLEYHILHWVVCSHNPGSDQFANFAFNGLFSEIIQSVWDIIWGNPLSSIIILNFLLFFCLVIFIIIFLWICLWMDTITVILIVTWIGIIFILFLYGFLFFDFLFDFLFIWDLLQLCQLLYGLRNFLLLLLWLGIFEVFY